MTIYTRLFEEKTLTKSMIYCNYLMSWGIQRHVKLIHRLTKINNHKDYYMVLLFEDRENYWF